MIDRHGARRVANIVPTLPHGFKIKGLAYAEVILPRLRHAAAGAHRGAVQADREGEGLPVAVERILLRPDVALGFKLDRDLVAFGQGVEQVVRPDFEPAVFIEIIVVLVVVQRVFIAVDRGVEQVEQPADFFPVGFVAFAVQKILDRLVALYREEGVKARDIHRDVVQRHRDAAVFDALPHRGVVGFQLGLRAGIAAARGFERVGGFGCGGGGGGKEADLPAQHFQQRRPGRKDGGSTGTNGGRSHRQRADGLAACAPCFG